MKQRFIPSLAGLLALLGACSAPVDTAPQAVTPKDGAPAPAPDSAGGWRLDATTSRLTFVSIKNNAVAESHRFADIEGGVTADGQATLRVALDSVETGIGIRDQRMRDMLFETGRYPQATVTLAVDPQAVKALVPGEHRIWNVQAALDLHGLSNRLPAEVRVTRLDEQRWLVTSEQPVLVNATNFGLINGIDALRRAAGLQAIGSGVPVSFALSLTRVPADGSTALEVGDPWLREVPPGAGAAGGYGEFRNRSDHSIRIARLQSPLSQRVEIHEMAMVDGQMRMRAVEDVSIAPGGTLSLKPGGYHLMFMGLNRAPKAGESVPLTVELEGGESVEITLPVRKVPAPGPHDGH
jgi:copper(I)-binding protein/polyisoprenoid-binding protein YceI